MKPVQLRAEYLENPFGLGETRPLLFWRLDSARSGAAQRAYRLRFASSQTLLETPDLGDSDWIPSDQTTHIEYSGAPLSSRQRVFWCVEIEDETGEKSRSEAAWFEIGLLEGSDWRARWIETPLVGEKRVSPPVPQLKLDFALENRAIRRARIYASALGVYEMHLNGARVGDEWFAPGWTDYARRVQTQTTDVTAQLRAGAPNSWRVFLGDGWYCGSVDWRGRQNYGPKPRFLAQLEIEFEDGQKQLFVTDENWEWASGFIQSADMQNGENHDLRLSYDTWQKVTLCDDAATQNIELCAPIAPPVRVIQTVAPLKSHRDGEKLVFDFGQNLVGFVRLRVRGEAGQRVQLRFAEVLEGGPLATEGAIYTANLRGAAQIDSVILGENAQGENGEEFAPKFTFHGFRYAEVSGIAADKILEIEAVVLSSDNRDTGDFRCSDPLVNQLQKNIWWGWRGNSLDLPTDCPQRDERLGWTGDAQVFVRTSAFLCDVAAFWREWARDVADAQTPSGGIPCVVPDVQMLSDDSDNVCRGASADGGPAWADAALICPWTIYRVYGDTRILAENYAVFERYLAFLESTARDFIRCYDDCEYFRGFGDWLALDGSGHTEGGTHKDLLGTAFFAHSADLMSRIARVLGRDEDAARYETLFQNVKSAFVNRFVTRAGLLSPPFQTPYLLALEFHLLPDELRPHAARELVREIKRRGGKLSTGFVGSPYINHVLSREGFLTEAYALLHQKEWPSWLYAVEHGATTIWERWDAWTHDKGFQDVGMNSFNHYAYGAVGAWLYQVVAGIELDPEIAGYKRFRLAPRPGGELTWAKAHLDTLHGRIESEWKIEGSTFAYRFVVPPNTRAHVALPDGTHFEAEAGTHEGTCDSAEKASPTAVL